MFDVNQSGQAQVVGCNELETIIPLRDQVLILPDPPKSTTKSGLVLPDTIKIPTCRGRVLAVSWFVSNAYIEKDVPEQHQIVAGDRVVFHFGGAMPNNFEADNPPVLVPVGNILGKVKKDGPRNKDAADDR